MLRIKYSTEQIIHKLRTGEGQFVEVPMFESMVSFNTLEHLCDNSFVPATASPGYYQRQLDPTRQPMRTKDGYIAFAPYMDDRWVRFFEAAGHGHVLKEARFIDKPTRRANMSQMFEVMATISPERTTDEWLVLMKQAQVPAMRSNTCLADFSPVVSLVSLAAARFHRNSGTPSSSTGFNVLGTPALRKYFWASTSAATWLQASGTSMSVWLKTIEPSGLRISLAAPLKAMPS